MPFELLVSVRADPGPAKVPLLPYDLPVQLTAEKYFNHHKSRAGFTIKAAEYCWKSTEKVDHKLQRRSLVRVVERVTVCCAPAPIRSSTLRGSSKKRPLEDFSRC